MYRFISNMSLIQPVTIKNQVVKVAIDSVEGDFVLNKYGHIRSDFAILAESNTNLEMARALEQMKASYEASSSQFDGMTFEQMVATVRPRWCQLPNEIDRFEQYLIDNALEFYKNLRKDEISNLKDEDVDTTSIEKPATIGGTPVEE